MSAWEDGYDTYIGHEKGKKSYKDTYGIPYIDVAIIDGKPTQVVKNQKPAPVPYDKTKGLAEQSVAKPQPTTKTPEKTTDKTKTTTTTPKAPTVDPMIGARDNLLAYARSQLSGRGLDFNTGYGKTIYDSVGARAGSFTRPEDIDYGIFDTIYNNTQTGAQNKARGELNSWLYDGAENDIFADNMDDAILDSILGTQRTDLMGQLDQRKARGQINDAGYSRALKELETQFGAGKSRANTMGMNVLNNYRGEARGRAAKIRGGLDNFSLASPFDTAGAKSQFDSFVGSKRDSLDADIRAAIGDTNFFDADKLFGTAGGTGGAGTANAGIGGTANTAQNTGLTPNMSLSSPLSSKDTKNKGF